LIEFVSYRPFAVRNARDTAFGAPRYAAYVLRSGTQSIAAHVDLGDSDLIDTTVTRFRTVLSNPRDQGVRQAARSLYPRS